MKKKLLQCLHWLKLLQETCFIEVPDKVLL